MTEDRGDSTATKSKLTPQAVRTHMQADMQHVFVFHCALLVFLSVNVFVCSSSAFLNC